VSVAVVIPLYNHERFIAGALRSVLEQTRPPERVIVIDDGSTDGSLEAARSAADGRVTVVSQQNAGAHAALNRGIGMAADAEFVGILNSDDLYEPGRIERCMRFLEDKPGTAAVVTRYRIIDAAGSIPGEEDARVKWMRSVWEARRESLPAWLGIANFAKTTSNLFGRAEYFREHPFRAYRYVHDYYFALEAALTGRLAVLDEELLRYRVHDSNTIKSGPSENLPREVLRMNVDLLRAFAPVLEKDAEVRARFADFFRELCRNYADFRLEPFLWLVAASNGMEELCESIDAVRFPELAGGKSRALRELMAQGVYERAIESLAASRWMALGRLMGVGPAILNDAATAEGKLAALRKACERSRWFKLGERLGLLYRDWEM